MVSGMIFATKPDDCTDYTETTMLCNRSDVLQAYKDYKWKAEKQTGRQIRKLRTDNGRKYLSKDFKEFLKSEGIIHQLSVECQRCAQKLKLNDRK